MRVNSKSGKPPFRPDLGNVGGVSWFVTDGSPYTGTAANAVTIPVDVQIPSGANVQQFKEADLLKIFNQEHPQALRTAEAQFRSTNNLTAGEQLTRRATRTIERNAARIAERSMWETVGRRVASSDSGIGQVILENSRFSRSGNGVFTLTNRANAISIRGGTAALLDVVKRNGVPAERQVIEAAEQLAHQGKITGKLQGVLRVGGRILIIAGAAADGYRSYTADDKVRETVKLAGGVGYFAGETIAETIYGLVIDGDRIHIPAEGN